MLIRMWDAEDAYEGLPSSRGSVSEIEMALVSLEETDRVRQRLQTKSGCLQLRQKPIEFLVAMRLRDTPVPIPNTMVKT